jgi:Xaa-Pro aminopeptidase
MDYRGRQQRLRSELSARKLSALLVTHLPNIHYLTGFTGSSGALIVPAQGAPAFFTDGRYAEQTVQEVKGANVRIVSVGALRGAVEHLSKRNRWTVGLEAQKLSWAESEQVKKLAPKVTFKPLTDVVERLRWIKDCEELRSIQKAINLASGVFDAVVPEIVPGVLESALAAEIEYMSKRLGASGMSFDTIVAAGKRSALPHGRASQAPVPAKGFVIFDFGVIVDGYCSDMTRTVHVGRADRRAERVYNAVLEAQLAGIKAVKAGVETSQVDQAARKVLEKAGLGGYFTHSTGHGVGLEIHESPGLRKKPKAAGTKMVKADRLEAGMVITIEPGVYIPGWGGVRIEDMVLVTDSGCDVLTPTAKELVVL